MDISAIARNITEDIAEFFHGRRLSFPPELKYAPDVSRALIDIRERWPQLKANANDQEIPVFVFSAGWRSGSTLVQRLILSSRELVVWGEPLGDAAFIGRLAYSLSYVSDKWPPQKFFMTGSSLGELASRWIANLTPEINFLRSAHRCLFLEWFKKPAKQRFGLERWGLKEVRLTIHHARYLKWLFPNARFVFVYRHPLDAFRSWKGNKWRSKWPGYYPRSAMAFGRHWRFLLEGFIEGTEEVDGLLIKFEDLVTGKVRVKEIADHVRVSRIDPNVLSKKIASPARKTRAGRSRITPIDRAIIHILCGALMRRLGYI